MTDHIPWYSSACNDEGPCGTLLDVAKRWKTMASRDHEALTGVSVDAAVMLDGWDAPRIDLLPSHLDQIADRLGTAPKDDQRGRRSPV